MAPELRKQTLRFYGFLFAALVHALTIMVLTIAVVNVVVQEVPPPIPEPLKIDIGDQVLLPPEAAPVEPEPVPVPPVGAETPLEDASDSPLAPNDEAMLEDPDEPPPEEITEASRRGLPGEPTPDASPDQLKQIVEGPKSEGVPKVFGVPIEGDTVFLVDVSGSMEEKHGHGTRLEHVIRELVEGINSLRGTDRFDIVTYCGDFTEQIKAWNGTLRLATEQGKADAIAWLDTLKPDGSTPTYEALLYVCTMYPATVQNVVLVTDGLPNAGTEANILSSIQRWMSYFNKANLICIGIGAEGLPFVKRLVHAVDGAYVEVK